MILAPTAAGTVCTMVAIQLPSISLRDRPGITCASRWVQTEHAQGRGLNCDVSQDSCHCPISITAPSASLNTVHTEITVHTRHFHALLPLIHSAFQCPTVLLAPPAMLVHSDPSTTTAIFFFLLTCSPRLLQLGLGLGLGFPVLHAFSSCNRLLYAHCGVRGVCEALSHNDNSTVCLALPNADTNITSMLSPCTLTTSQSTLNQAPLDIQQDP